VRIVRFDACTPMKFESSGVFTADEGWIHKKRVLNSFEIIAVIEGTLYMEQDGESRELNKNDLMLLLPGKEHCGYKKVKKGTSFFWAHFTPRGSYHLLGSEAELQNLNQENVKDSLFLPLYFRRANFERILILCSQLCHISESHYLNAYATDYAITSLLAEITEQFLRTSQPGKMCGKMEKILEWIRVNSGKSISLSDVAREFNYSKEYLSRHFHRITGVTMQKYINRLRIAKAKELLCQGDWENKEIAKIVGIRNEKYFLRLFKECERLTPRQFRNAYSKIHYNNK